MVLLGMHQLMRQSLDQLFGRPGAQELRIERNLVRYLAAVTPCKATAVKMTVHVASALQVERAGQQPLGEQSIIQKIKGVFEATVNLLGGADLQFCVGTYKTDPIRDMARALTNGAGRTITASFTNRFSS
jgi:hypothetical protein